MLEPQGLRTAYGIFGLSLMALLLGDFTIRLVQPQIEIRWGWVYT